MRRHQLNTNDKSSDDEISGPDGDAIELGPTYFDNNNTNTVDRGIAQAKNDTNTRMPILTGLEGVTTERRPWCFCYRQWVCCVCVRFLGLPWMYKIPIVLVVIAIIIMAVLSLDGNSCPYKPVTITPLPDPDNLLPAGRSPPTPAAKKRREFLLTLLGDSLIIDPEWKYHFNDKIRNFLGNYNVTVYNHGRRAERMDDILIDTRLSVLNYSRSPSDWAKRPPDGVIIMSVSDVVTGGMAQPVPWAFGSDAYYAHRRVYADQLAAVVRVIKAARIPLAIASPGTVEGEGYRAFMPSRLAGLAAPMADYCEFVQGWAAAHDVPYIDVHNTFLKQIPPYRVVYNGTFRRFIIMLVACPCLRLSYLSVRQTGCVTRDGEHPSDHGSTIMAKMFAEAAIQWVYPTIL